MPENLMVPDEAVSAILTDGKVKGKVRGRGVSTPYRWVGRAISQMSPAEINLNHRVPTSEGKYVTVEDILSMGNQDLDPYVHEQTELDIIWYVTHGLNRFVNVTIVLADGTVAVGTITYTNTNELTIEFNMPLAGKAYVK